MKEVKRYGVRPARTPQKHDSLSGTVLVSQPGGRSYTYIHFDPSLVEAVGKALPQGVSKEHPAYLKASHSGGKAPWKIFAMYIKEEKGALLWEAETMPLWITKLRKAA